MPPLIPAGPHKHPTAAPKQRSAPIARCPLTDRPSTSASEGLAQAFEAGCTGEVPLYAQGTPEPSHRQLAFAALGQDPANDGRWFFGSADLPRWFGYQLGYELVTKQLPGLNRSAAQLVAEPAATLLDRHR